MPHALIGIKRKMAGRQHAGTTVMD